MIQPHFQTKDRYGTIGFRSDILRDIQGKRGFPTAGRAARIISSSLQPAVILSKAA